MCRWTAELFRPVLDSDQSSVAARYIPGFPDGPFPALKSLLTGTGTWGRLFSLHSQAPGSPGNN
jgi:hypothetical protein